MNNGDIVKLRDIVDFGDEKLLFKIVEMRIDRALVAVLNSGMTIAPTFVYSIYDFEEVK